MSPDYKYPTKDEVLSESTNHMTVKYTLLQTGETITVTHDKPISDFERLKFGEMLSFPSMFYNKDEK